MPLTPAEVVSLNAALAQVVASFTAVVPPPPPVVPPVVPPVPPPPVSHQGDDITITPANITTPFDTIPNFPIVTGFVVPAGQILTWNTVNTTQYDTIRIESGGTLQFSSVVNTELHVTNLLILPGGTLDINTPDPGITTKIVVNDVPFDASDPQQWGHGVICLGNINIAGAPKTAYVQVQDVKQGDTMLTLRSPVSGWQVGDLLVLPDSRQLNWDLALASVWTETVKVASVSADGLTVTLAAPALHPHKGAYDSTGTQQFWMWVQNLTRNVCVKSTNATGTRGHFVAMMRAGVNITDCMFLGMGRTTVSQYSATNIADRISVLFRHLYTPAIFSNNAVFCLANLSGAMQYRWGIALNDAHYATIQENVLFNWAGAGIALERGNETGNLIDSNYCCHIWGQGGGPWDRGNGEGGYEGAGIWTYSFNSIITNNIVADSYIGYNFALTPNTSATIPTAKANCTYRPAESVKPNYTTMPLLGCTGNEGFGGMMQQGFYVWDLAMGADRWHLDPKQARSVIGIDFWNVSKKLFYCYQFNQLTWVTKSLCDITKGGTYGYFAGDYIGEGLIITGSIEGCAVGVLVSSIGVKQTIQNCTLKNWRNVVVSPPWWLNSADTLTMPRNIVVDHCTMTPLAGNYAGTYGPSGNVVMFLDPGQEDRNLLEPTTVTIIDDTGTRQVYYAEAAATAILPPSLLDGRGVALINGCHDPATGLPVLGMTNAQAFAQWGQAFAGMVAPATAVVVPGIVGLVTPTVAAN